MFIQENLQLLKCYFAGTVIKADLELVKDAGAVRIIHAQDCECCSGINKNPCSVALNGNRDDWHQVASMQGVLSVRTGRKATGL